MIEDIEKKDDGGFMGYILKGIGDSVTGKNEIVPTFDAKIYNFYSQVEPGVIGSEKDKFPLTIIDRGIKIGAGMAHAFGYFGMSDEEVQFNYVIPSSQTQYSKVYAEIDLSSRPQSFSINVTPQSDTTVIELLSDNLSEITTGIYQVPLYLITIHPNGTIVSSDIRTLLNRISYARHSDDSTNSLNLKDNGTIAGSVTAVTQSEQDNSTKVATTEFVTRAVTNIKNIIQGDISIPVAFTSISENWIKRQVNFIIGRLYFDDSNANRYETTYIKIGQLPSGFEPKTNLQFPISVSNWVMSGAWQMFWATIQTDGGIYVTSNSSAIRAYGYKFDFGYEIK